MGAQPRPSRGAGPYDEAAALVREHLAGLPFEHVVIEDATDEALEAEFLGDGWKVERDVVMALGQTPTASSTRPPWSSCPSARRCG